MKITLSLIVLLICVAVTDVLGIGPADLVGTWWGKGMHRYNAHYTLYADHTYSGGEADMLFEGRWKLHSGKKLELISREKAVLTNSRVRKLFVIDSFSRNSLRVTLEDGTHDTWTRKR